MDTTGPDPILILGAPRSGTTWLAKIFDSHPDVLYLHEPDAVLRNPTLPLICPNSEIKNYVSVARDYIARLCATQTLKTVGLLPIFPKAYRNRVAHGVRLALILGLHVVAKLCGGAASL